MRFILILLGAPLGYIVSYFCQAGVIRGFVSLGDYVSHCGNVLFPREGANRIVQSACQTAWFGIIGGVIGMIILVVIFGRNKEKEQNKSFDFPQIQPPIPIEDTTPPTEDTTPPQKQHFSWANKGILLVVGVIVVVALIGSAVYLGGFNKSSHGEIWVRAQDDESVITIVAKTNSVEVKVTTPQDDGPSITYYHGTIPPNQARDIPRRQALIIESKQYENIRLIIDGRTWDMPTSVIYIKK